MSEAASKPAPVGRLRVAVYGVDLPRRSALSRVVAEARHVVVGAQDAADLVLADRGCPPGGNRPIVILGGGGHDLPRVLSRAADASQIDAGLSADCGLL